MDFENTLMNILKTINSIQFLSMELELSNDPFAGYQSNLKIELNR